MVGTPAFHGVLALHDLSGESFDLFEKILLRAVHVHHHSMDARLWFAVALWQGSQNSYLTPIDNPLPYGCG